MGRWAVLIVAVTAMAGAVAVGAGVPRRERPTDLSVDLAGGADVVVGTRHNFGGLGTKVVGLGDVNGDGLGDVAVAAPHDSRPGRDQAGAVYVVFGSRSRARVDPASRAFRGFRILGPAGSSMAGMSVAPAGDFNGDGLKDLIVGAPGGSGDRAAYVVFGKRDRGDVDLRSPGARAVALVGPQGSAVGDSVASAGDMNHDGRGDVAVSALGSDGSASVFVVFGATGPGRRDLAQPGKGFKVSGLDPGPPDYGSAPTLGTAGDVNGDGTGDLVIGTPGANSFVGAAYVVFGKASPTGIDVRQLGHRGFRIVGSSNVGYAVAGVGDLNHSGRGAIIVSGPGRAISVVFGSQSTGTVDLNRLGRRGFLITGAGPTASAAGIGDVNGDRRPDVLIGYSLTSSRRRPGAGAAYVLFGSSRSRPVDLHHLGRNGYRVDGPARDASLGQAVAGLGDFNGDGTPDYMVSSEVAGPGSKGAAYILFGSGPPRVTIAGSATAISLSSSPRFGLEIACPANTVGHCRGSLDIRHGSHRVVTRTAKFVVVAGAQTKVGFRLLRRTQAALRDANLPIRAIATVVNDAKTRNVIRKTLSLQQP